VVDAGPDPRLIDNCLDMLGVQSVGMLVLTHMHLDHYGGMAGVFEDREVSSVMIGSSKPELPPEAAAEMRRQSVVPVRGTAGQSGSEGVVAWQVLWPAEAPAGRSENDSSVVLLLEVRQEDGTELHLLLTGDLEAEAAAAMLHGLGGRTPAVDLIKVSHHGARNGGDELFEQLNPQSALISVGADNDYGHPAPEILAALDRLGIPAFRTDLVGTVLVDLREGRLVITGAG